jgi:2-amino-4-hydroxy-6-hydroxymethyldihydropteridine diphosphokinase
MASFSSADSSRAAVVGLGSNLGDRRATLERAVGELRDRFGVVRVSALYESPALGPPQPDYLNAAALLARPPAPLVLLTELLSIERAAGRERRQRWGPRTLDLDILWIERLLLRKSELSVPHPELALRPFALRPLLDVVPDASDPESGESYATILSRLDLSELRQVAGQPLDSFGGRW